MAREVTGTDLWSHQSHIPKQNVTLQRVIIHDHNYIVIGCLIKHIKCFRIIVLYIKGMMKKDINFYICLLKISEKLIKMIPNFNKIDQLITK